MGYGVKETELFLWLKTEMPDLEHSPNEFDGFDCATQQYGMFIELKSRNTHYDTLLLERKKYDFLTATATALGLRPYYINSTPDGVWRFSLDELTDIVWEEKWLPVTTEFLNRSKIMKEVTFLHTDTGVKIK
jgi:hypothetical protein